jgi:hypothetical protein
VPATVLQDVVPRAAAKPQRRRQPGLEPVQSTTMSRTLVDRIRYGAACPRLKQCELLRMLADHHHVIDNREHLRTQIAETAVAEDDDDSVRGSSLCRNLKRRSHR